MNVRISFHHANPDAGNESFLVRFERGGADESPCLLVDAGHGVNPDSLLGPTDRLAGICLTHAHLDHYSSLAAAHRDGVPVFTSPATAAVLDDVFDVASDEYGVRTTDAVADAVTPITDWASAAPGVEVHPVPAGHAPGAVGFLVRATDGEETHHLLATGDFTRRRAGGFPGFDPEGFVDVDVLFLPAATDDAFGEALTDALGTALEHAHGGAPTLVATSGLVGVQVAYLLSALVDEYGLGVPVRVVGQVAKLYDRLGYDCPGVERIPRFDDPRACLGQGAVAVAGPEIPRERSSGRLFGLLREDPNACVVQLVGSGETPIREGRCTLHSYELANHPDRGTLESVHDAVDPTETVIVHSHGGAGRAFNDLGSVVWGAGDADEHVLYDGRQWLLPPWAGGGAVTARDERNLRQFAGSELLASFPLPSLDRHDEPDLGAEGIDEAAVAALLHHGPDAGASPDAPSGTDTATASEPESEPMTADDDATDREEDRPANRPDGLIDTVGPDLDGPSGANASEALDDSSLTPRNMVSARATERLRESSGEAASDGGEEGDAAEGAADSVTEAETETGGSEAQTADTDAQNDGEAADSESNSDSDSESSAPDESARSDDGDIGEPTGTEAAAAGADADRDRDRDRDRNQHQNRNRERPGSGGVAMRLNPLAVALAERHADGSVDELVTEAVRRYVEALLAGDATGDEADRLAVEPAAAPDVERLLDALVDDSDEFDSAADLVAAGVASALGTDADRTVELRGPDGYRELLDAAVRNEAFALDSRERVVEAAVARHLIGE